jgi:SAM-dependent methyltransferase
MTSTEGASTFRSSGDAYDRYMGRYSVPLAARLADSVGVHTGQRVLDVGCGPGALTAELARRVGAANVSAIDPSPSYVEACRARHPGVDVREAQAESLPFEDDSFDAALAQLVFQFMADPLQGAQELRRVVRPGGAVGGCVWDYAEGMTMLAAFWGSARELDTSAPHEADTLRFGRGGELGALFRDAGLGDVESGALVVEAAYTGFDDFWNPVLGGVGPGGAYCASLDPERQEALREACFTRLGSPRGAFTLSARAWSAVGRA